MSYHDHPAWNHSRVKLLPDEPKLFHGLHVTREFPQPESAAMAVGTALHSLVLEGIEPVTPPPEVLTSNGQRRGNAYKAWLAEHPGPALSATEAETVQRMAAGIRANDQATALLGYDGPVEQEVYWTDDHTGLPLRAKLDKLAWVAPGVVWVADVKTTKASLEKTEWIWAYVGGQRVKVEVPAFYRESMSRQYHRQAAWYMRAAREWLDQNGGDDVATEAFVFIAVRNCAPFNCRVFPISVEVLGLGAAENRAALRDLARRLTTDDWQARDGQHLNEIQYPYFAFNQEVEYEYDGGTTDDESDGDGATDAATVADA